jgi:putative endonuclease
MLEEQRLYESRLHYYRTGYWLYILRSIKDGKLYVGATKNVENRLKQHNEGVTLSTRYRKPFELIHKECYNIKREALKRERYLKSLKGSKEKKRILENSLIMKNMSP